MKNTTGSLVAAVRAGALAMALGAGLAVGACGDTTAKDAPTQPGQGHKHDGTDTDCPMCKSLREQAAAEDAQKGAGKGVNKETGVLDMTVKSIDGKDFDLAQYKGKVVMVVNVASKCGFTPQYKGLQALYDGRKDQGFVVLGFPANDFMGQEPGSNGQIAKYCQSEHGVSFPMFEKISVKGDGQHELFKRLSLAAKDQGGEPGWNFTKYLVGRDGKFVARFKHSTPPDAKDLVARLDEELAKK